VQFKYTLVFGPSNHLFLFLLSMKTEVKFFAFLLFMWGSTTTVFAQQEVVDSLKKELGKAIHDTARCEILYNMVESEYDETLWPKYNEELRRLCEKDLGENPSPRCKYLYSKQLAYSLNNMGLVLRNKGNDKEAMDYYEKSLKIRKDINDKMGIAQSLTNIGSIYKFKGDLRKALEYQQKSLVIQEEIHDDFGMANSCNNLGFLFSSQGDKVQAMKYYQKGLAVQQKLKDKEAIGFTINNIANLYDEEGKREKAMELYQEALRNLRAVNNKDGMATTLNNIGGVLRDQKYFDKALDTFQLAYKIGRSIDSKDDMAESLIDIGTVYELKKEYSKAIKYLQEGLTISQALGYPETIRNASRQLYYCYKATSDTKSALSMYELYIIMRDSIQNSELKRANISNQYKYEYAKKAAADSVRVVKEKEVVAVQLKEEKTQRYALYGGLVLTLIFGSFMFNRFRITRKQKNIIEFQKHMVDEKQREILDYIHYAKRIQESLLPTEKYISRILEKLNPKKK
jgi:tetratricopeptide (TPR) repeat protein